MHPDSCEPRECVLCIYGRGTSPDSPRRTGATYPSLLDDLDDGAPDAPA